MGLVLFFGSVIKLLKGESDSMNAAERFERVMKMEEIFDSLSAALAEDPDALLEKADMLSALSCYYEGGLWLSDFEADERGELPTGLKRGVLSEDGVYNLLCKIDELKKGTVS